MLSIDSFLVTQRKDFQMRKSKHTFQSDYGRNPVAGVDYDPDKISSQDDYDYLTPVSPIKKLENMVAKSGTQKAVAEMLSISPAYLCDVLQGRREVSENLARRIGYRRVISFELLSGPKDADKTVLVTVASNG
jgi:hypothetical protein